MLNFLHLSDIHFSKPYQAVYDLDQQLRSELLRDAVEVKGEVGSPPHAILISGDIAFAGQSNEYEIAQQWISELCVSLNCPPENVWCVPGNHDVCHPTINADITIRMCHKELRTCNPCSINSILEDYVKAPNDVLYAPLRNYNAFAQKYNCPVDHSTPWWEEEFELNDGSMLRLRGLNSTLISDAEDNRGSNKLVLGGYQYGISRSDGVEYMVMCHHPPDWLIDQDEVSDGLKALTKVQLFGHKHRLRMTKVDESLILSAGAVHPSRQESDWMPRYNWIGVTIDTVDAERKMLVRVYPRVWQQENSTFIADSNSCGGQEYKVYNLALSPWESPGNDNDPKHSSAERAEIANEVEQVDEQPTRRSPKRMLSHCFWKLPYIYKLSGTKAEPYPKR
ncbi:MAG: metallophosphoesterase [Planctomycetes bacterium]|nr:metallophosphoesterase [Planctomycetota bacterium]